MCAYSVFNTFPVYPLSAKPLILLAFCRYRYHTSLFDRPDWQRLLSQVEEGNISTIIVKDMSRLGRDYLKVGYYTEVLFPGSDIRFIAINNNVDSANQQDSDFTPFLNIINEWYAKDTSKKIRSVFKSKGQSGKPLCTNPPYGYIKDPEDKMHWVVDEDAAKVVKEAFRLCMQGYGPTQIAKEFSERKIMNPTAHAKASGINIPDNRGHDDDYIWRGSTIVHMLSRQEYLGHTVNFKTYRKSYKNKKQLKNDPSEWQIFENTHEAIIEAPVFEVVQKIRDGRRRVTPMGEMPILSGMLFCVDCGNKLYQVRHRGWEHDKEHFVCATYRKIKGGCSSHQIRNVVVEELLLDGIRRVTAFARDHEPRRGQNLDEPAGACRRAGQQVSARHVQGSGRAAQRRLHAPAHGYRAPRRRDQGVIRTAYTHKSPGARSRSGVLLSFMICRASAAALTNGFH